MFRFTWFVGCFDCWVVLFGLLYVLLLCFGYWMLIDFVVCGCWLLVVCRFCCLFSSLCLLFIVVVCVLCFPCEFAFWICLWCFTCLTRLGDVFWYLFLLNSLLLLGFSVVCYYGFGLLVCMLIWFGLGLWLCVCVCLVVCLIDVWLLLFLFVLGLHGLSCDCCYLNACDVELICLLMCCWFMGFGNAGCLVLVWLVFGLFCCCRFVCVLNWFLSVYASLTVYVVVCW